MKVNVEIDPDGEELTLIIRAREWSEEVDALVKKIKSSQPKRLVGLEDDRTILLDPQEIDCVFAENRKVFALVKKRKIELKLKLYEIESLLQPYHFTRFTKSVVGNLKQIERFELSFNGNLCVHFKSGNKEYVSRQYVKDLKGKLIYGGGQDDC